MSMTAALNEMHTALSKRHEVSSHTSGNLRHHFWGEMRITNVTKCSTPQRGKGRYPKPSLKTRKETNIEKLSLYHVKKSGVVYA